MICPFCGKNEKATVEHVFGQQFRSHFPSVARHIEQVGDFAGPWLYSQIVQTENGYVTHQVARELRTPELHEVKVKVGAACNNGWMARLDDDAVEVVKALTAGPALDRPDASQAAILALWLVKTGMAYDLYQPQDEKAYSDALRHGLFEHRTPPTGTTVYMGYEPHEPDWLPFWQHGWHVAPVNTPAQQIVTAPPNLSTTFFGIEGLRLVAHRIAPEMPYPQRQAAHAWLRTWMPRSRMVQISPSLAKARFEPMNDQSVDVGMHTLQGFVQRRTRSVAPPEPST